MADLGKQRTEKIVVGKKRFPSFLRLVEKGKKE